MTWIPHDALSHHALDDRYYYYLHRRPPPTCRPHRVRGRRCPTSSVGSSAWNGEKSKFADGNLDEPDKSSNNVRRTQLVYLTLKRVARCASFADSSQIFAGLHKESRMDRSFSRRKTFSEKWWGVLKNRNVKCLQYDLQLPSTWEIWGRGLRCVVSFLSRHVNSVPGRFRSFISGDRCRVAWAAGGARYHQSTISTFFFINLNHLLLLFAVPLMAPIANELLFRNMQRQMNCLGVDKMQSRLFCCICMAHESRWLNQADRLWEQHLSYIVGFDGKCE